MRFNKDADISEIEVGGHQRCDIMVAVPTLGKVPIEWVVGFGRMQFPVNGQVFQHIVKGFEVGVARNLAVEALMRIPEGERPKWLFFFGDDMVPEWSGFIKLFEEAENNKWDCLTGLYYLKGEPPTPLTWRYDKIGRYLPGIHFKSGDVIEVDLTGLDFTLIRTELIEKMKGPWFKTGPSIRKDIPEGVAEYMANPESIIRHTEDTWFYGKARELGAKIGVHSGVRVAHYDNYSGMFY